MARLNVSVPDELVALVREQLPGLNVSGVLQAGLRAQLACPHDELECRRCGHHVNRWALVDEAVGLFYADALFELGELARRGGTAEGAVRVLKRVATDKGVTEATHRPLPRPSRAERQAYKVNDLRRSA